MLRSCTWRIWPLAIHVEFSCPPYKSYCPPQDDIPVSPTDLRTRSFIRQPRYSLHYRPIHSQHQDLQHQEAQQILHSTSELFPSKHRHRQLEQHTSFPPGQVTELLGVCISSIAYFCIWLSKKWFNFSYCNVHL